MKRNLGGERDLDYIIAAALRGMDRACLDYGVRAGLIFCLAREFDYELNEIIVKKADEVPRRGVVGIDLAGPEQHTLELGGDVERYRDLFARARAAGLGTTVHTGETAHTGAEGVLAVLDKLKPERIGHGIAAAHDEEAMRKLVERGVGARAVPDVEPAHARGGRHRRAARSVRKRCARPACALTINTDGTYLLGTTLRQEFDLLLAHQIFDSSEALRSIETARQATFVR